MLLTVFDIRGVPCTRRERIDATIVARTAHIAGQDEAWIAADILKGAFRVVITGPEASERTATFASFTTFDAQVIG